jgi:hypothetical protein
VEPSSESEVVTLFLDGPLSGKRTHNDSLLRLYRNVVFLIRAYDAEVDVRLVADGLLALAKNNSKVPLHEKRPSITLPTLPDKLSPGEEIRIKVPAAPDPCGDFQSTDYQVQVQTEGGAEFFGFQDENAYFRLSQPGEGEIRVQAIDRRTLLSKEVALDVHVKPE